MNTKAYVIDFYSHDSYHEVINLGYLMMIASIYQQVFYIAERKSCDNLIELMDQCGFAYENVVFQKKDVSKFGIKNKSVGYLIKIVKVSFLNFIYYLKVKKDSDVFFNNNLFVGMPLIYFFAFWKRNSIYDVCHNEMENIDWRKARCSRLTRFLYPMYWFNFKFLKISKKFHFILLSTKMVEYFSLFVPPKNRNRFFAMDHCYIRPNSRPPYLFDTSKIKIGIPSAVSKDRGFDYLTEIVFNVSNTNVHFYSISKMNEELSAPNFTELNPTKQLFDFDQYSSYVKGMDYLLFFYDPNSYKLTASGAILEAIWNEKPILALRNAYFDYLFEKYGPIGYLCDNVKELLQKIDQIETGPVKPEFVENLRMARKDLLPENVLKQLRKIIE